MVKFKKSLLAIICSAGLMLSIQAQANVLHDAVNSNDYQQVEKIINSNPSLLNGFDDDGNTPLHAAIKNENSAALESFMKYKKTINPQAVNKQGETPLVYSIKNKKYQALVTMLQNGFNPFYKDQNQKDSFDYVAQYGDDTIKDIYKSYYSQNKARIDQVNESKKNTAAANEVKTTVQKELTASKASSGKAQTVADLLMGNVKNKKNNVSEPVATVIPVESPKNLVEVPKKPEEATLTTEQLNDIYKKIDNLKIDQASLDTLKEQVESLKRENQNLKNQLNFRQDLGRDHLTEQERIMANSKYAPIYQQQMLYQTTDEQDSSDLPFMEPGKDMIVISDKDSADNINTAIPAITNNINNVTASTSSAPNTEVTENNKALVIEPTKEEIKKDDNSQKETPIVITSEIPVVGQSPIINRVEEKAELNKNKSTLVKEEKNNETTIDNDAKNVKVSVDNQEGEQETKTSNKFALFIIILSLAVGAACIIGYIYIIIKEKKDKKITKEKQDKE